MRLVQGVLRSLAAGKSPSCQGFSIARSLATSSASAIEPDANTNSSETMEEFERSVFGDPPGNSLSSSSFFQKLDQQKRVNERSAMNSRFNGSRRGGPVDGLNDSSTSLTDGLDGKLKDAATYFEYDVNEVEKEDYKFRPDVTFWPGNTYDVKDLDLTKPGIRKPSKRSEFEVTTKEVLEKADFRNVKFLANFITEAGVIHKRSKHKISAKAQRKIAREIKTARAFGLMPFTTMGTKHFVYGRNMQDVDKDYEYEVYEHNFVDEAS
nr:ribosomal protein S18 [Tanacetum cinerariifolium]